MYATVYIYFLSGEAVVHDAFQLYNNFFDVVIDANYASPTAAFETVSFIYKNLTMLCYRTPLLQKYFPNIFKVSKFACDYQLSLDEGRCVVL